MYKLCEAVETQVMLSLIEKLLEEGAQSIVWMHDGLYVHCEPLKGTKRRMVEEGVKARFAEVMKAMNLNLQLRTEELHNEYKAALRKYREKLQQKGEVHQEPTEAAKKRLEGIAGEDRGKQKPEIYIDIHEPYRLPPKGSKKPIKRKNMSSELKQTQEGESNGQQGDNQETEEREEQEEDWRTESEEEDSEEEE